MPLAACSRARFYTRFIVSPATNALYHEALREFLQRYGYRETLWRPAYGHWKFVGVYEGLRTRFWINELETDQFEAVVEYKWDLPGMFAPGEDVMEIGGDFERRISSQGIRILQGPG